MKNKSTSEPKGRYPISFGSDAKTIQAFDELTKIMPFKITDHYRAACQFYLDMVNANGFDFVFAAMMNLQDPEYKITASYGKISDSVTTTILSQRINSKLKEKPLTQDVSKEQFTNYAPEHIQKLLNPDDVQVNNTLEFNKNDKATEEAIAVVEL